MLQSNYRILKGKGIEQLDKKVNAMLVQGYIVCGGVFRDSDVNQTFYQAVVKPNDKDLLVE